MKTKTVTTVIAILLTAILIAACTKQNRFTTEIVVLRDITETHLASPDAESVNRFFNLTADKWSGAIFRFADISDVSYNRTSETSIEAEQKWFSNELSRGKKIQRFNEEVEKILSASENENVGKKYSSVYLPVARELNQLSQSKAQRRILLVYSDLMENQKDLSFYDCCTLKQLKNGSEVIKIFLEGQEAITNLEGIEVYFIYQPADAEADSKFRIVSEFYKNLLENKGAKVTVSAN